MDTSIFNYGELPEFKKFTDDELMRPTSRFIAIK